MPPDNLPGDDDAADAYADAESAKQSPLSRQLSASSPEEDEDEDDLPSPPIAERSALSSSDPTPMQRLITPVLAEGCRICAMMGATCVSCLSTTANDLELGVSIEDESK